jgi:hypothetical protein
VDAREQARRDVAADSGRRRLGETSMHAQT